MLLPAADMLGAFTLLWVSPRKLFSLLPPSPAVGHPPALCKDPPLSALHPPPVKTASWLLAHVCSASLVSAMLKAPKLTTHSWHGSCLHELDDHCYPPVHPFLSQYDLSWEGQQDCTQYSRQGQTRVLYQVVVTVVWFGPSFPRAQRGYFRSSLAPGLHSWMLTGDSELNTEYLKLRSIFPRVTSLYNVEINLSFLSSA